MIPTTKKGWFLVGNQVNNTSSLSVTSMSGEQFLIPAPCLGHEITVNPTLSNQVFATEKSGPTAYMADISKNTLIREVTLKENSVFYGHGIFSGDGKYLYATVMNYDDNAGYISMRDSSTLQEVKRLASFGSHPHQLRWVKKDKVIAVANAFSPIITTNHSLLNYINIETGELVKSFHTNVRSRHFTVTSDQETIFIGRNTSPEDATKSASEMKRYYLFDTINTSTSSLSKSPVRLSTAPRAECLSHVLIENLSLAIMTLVGFNEVVVWDYKNSKEIFSLKTQDIPQGITLSDDKKFIHITFTKNDQHSYINFYPLDSFLKQDFKPSFTVHSGNGSHLTLLERLV